MSDVGLRCNILTHARFLTTSDCDMNQSFGSQHPNIMYLEMSAGVGHLTVVRVSQLWTLPLLPNTGSHVTCDMEREW